MKLTLLRYRAPYLTDRYSERKEDAAKSDGAALAAAAMRYET